MTTETVSLCLIVKNEAPVLRDCLNSVGHLVAEMIVVDTGSSDNTREMAAAAGARIFDWEWRDDFAAARNFALDQATGTWLLVLDADEMLSPIPAEDFRALLAPPEVEGYYLTIFSRLADGTEAVDEVVRLFRNKPDYRFAGIIHEQVAGSILRGTHGSVLRHAPAILHITHHGYLPEALERQHKSSRNIALIERALRCDPHQPFLLYSLGLEYFQMQQPEKGIPLLERALALLNGDEGYLHDLLIALGSGLFQTAAGTRLTEFLEQALRLLPDDPDLHWLAGLSELTAGELAPAEAHLERAAGTGLASSHSFHTVKGELLHRLGLSRAAGREYLQALKAAPQFLGPFIGWLDLKRQGAPFRWSDLARFAPLSIKERLSGSLLAQREWPLASFLLLLAILEAVEERQPGNALRCCCRLVEEAEKHSCPLPQVATAAQYLTNAGWELRFKLGFIIEKLSPDEALGYGEITALVEHCLELMIALTAPPWQPLWEQTTANRPAERPAHSPVGQQL